MGAQDDCAGRRRSAEGRAALGSGATDGGRWFGVACVMDLLDRGREREVFDQLIDGARVGRSGVLVVRGMAGIGKTALLQYATESAPDLALARAVGVESEM